MKKSSIFFFLLGVVGIVFMIWKTDFSVIDWDGTVLKNMPIWLSAGIIIWAIIYLLHVLSYRIIMGEDKNKVPLGFLIKLTLSGFALNEVTPVGLIGGEPFRIVEMKPYLGSQKAVSTTLTFTVMHVSTHLLFLFTAALLYFIVGCPGGTVVTVFVAIVAILLGAVLFVFYRYGGRPLVRPVLKFCSKLPFFGKKIAKLMQEKNQTITEIDDSMVEFHTRKKSFVQVAAIEYIDRLLEVGEFYVLLRLIGSDISYVYCMIGVAASALIGNLLFIIPLQVGTREASLAAVLSWASVDFSFGVTASLFARIRGLIYIVIGITAILFGSKKKGETPAKTE
ncbi:MAG: flippase-like domain-containing protein [Clostridiales bacterium]|nr:flippase-like domain-containing protein [Candidatus Equinaster intestinalis]